MSDSVKQQARIPTLIWLLFLLGAVALVDHLAFRGIARAQIEGTLTRAYQSALSWEQAELNWTLAWLALPFLTAFLTFSNIYLKISMQASRLTLRASTFLNIYFGLYVIFYFVLSSFALLVLRDLAVQNWFVGAFAASALGIGIGSADIQFGGFSIIPLYEFLLGLEQMAIARMSVRAQELDVARIAHVREELTARMTTEVLIRECRLQDIPDQRITELQNRAGEDEQLLRAFLAREIIVQSEPNAERLLEAGRKRGFRRVRKDNRQHKL